VSLLDAPLKRILSVGQMHWCTGTLYYLLQNFTHFYKRWYTLSWI